MERSAKIRAEKATRAKEAGERNHIKGDIYQLVIISHRSRPIDASNCCAKYIEDAIVGEGLMPDDSIIYCPRPPIVLQITGVKRNAQKTEVFLFKMKR